MSYAVLRIDGKEDLITSKEYSSYDEAYKAIEKICGDLCCSDTDLDFGLHYEILEIK